MIYLYLCLYFIILLIIIIIVNYTIKQVLLKKISKIVNIIN